MAAILLHGWAVIGIGDSIAGTVLPFMRKASRISFAVFLMVTAPVGAYAGYLRMTGNLHVVAPGMLYRSGRLDRDQLERVVTRDGIRTVVNLENGRPDPAEESIVDGYGLRYVRFPLLLGVAPTLQRMISLAGILADAPKLILVHCSSGAGRSGLASAIFRLAVLGQPSDSAARSLSITYGHFPWLGSRTAAMDRAFDRFSIYWQTKGGFAAVR